MFVYDKIYIGDRKAYRFGRHRSRGVLRQQQRSSSDDKVVVPQAASVGPGQCGESVGRRRADGSIRGSG